MNLIIETDIGHDPDDFFALCYFFSAGVDVRAILLSPGDESQVTIVSFLLKELGKNIPIGVPKIGRRKEKLTSIHKYLVEKYKYPSHSDKYYLGEDVIRDTMINYPGNELFICGAVKNTGAYLAKHERTYISKAVMQGGFIG